MDIANKAIEKVDIWFRTNKLSLNIGKTNYCIFKNKTVVADNIPNLIVNNININRVKSCKYLGIIIDDRLSFTEHIDNVVSMIKQYCGIYYKLRLYLPKSCLKKLYYALIYPHLTYGLEIYGNTADSYLDPLLKINNKILRILQNKPIRTARQTLYNNYNTLPISTLRDFKIATLLHRCVHPHRDLLLHHPMICPMFSNIISFITRTYTHTIQEQNQPCIFNQQSYR